MADFEFPNVPLDEQGRRLGCWQFEPMQVGDVVEGDAPAAGTPVTWKDGDVYKTRTMAYVASYREFTEEELESQSQGNATPTATMAIVEAQNALASSFVDVAGDVDWNALMGSIGNAIAVLAGRLADLTDDEAVGMRGAILPWTEGEAVKVGQVRRHDGGLYRCVQAHTAQAGWEPPATPALWEAISFDAQGVEEWHEPAGAHDAPKAGDLRSRGGKVWRSLINGNHTEPGTEEGARWWVEVPQE